VQHWEYITIAWDDIHKLNNRDINQFLNDSYGENGWELISVAVYPHVQGSMSGFNPGGVSGSSSTTFSTILFFKRPK
jgi:hypothetical protein